MSIRSLQIEKIVKRFVDASLKQGFLPNPIDVRDAISTVFDGRHRFFGAPVTLPASQPRRKSFEIELYNSFLNDVEFDLEVLFSFYRRLNFSTIDVNNFLEVDRAKIRAVLIDLLEQTESFGQIKEIATDVKVDSKTFTFRSFKNVVQDYRSVGERTQLNLDINNGVVTLPYFPQDMELVPFEQYHEAIDFPVIFDVNTALIIENTNTQPFKNIFISSNVGWSHRLVLNKQLQSVVGYLELDLNGIRSMNSITIEPLTDRPFVYWVEFSQENSTYLQAGPKVLVENLGEKISFPSVKADKARVYIQKGVDEISKGEYIYNFSIRKLRLEEILYQDAGELLIGNISIDDKRIVAASLKVDQQVPNGAAVDYFLSINDGNESRPIFEIKAAAIQGKDDPDGVIRFSTAQEIAGISSVTRGTVFKTVDHVDFIELGLDDVGPLTTAQGYFLEGKIVLHTTLNQFRTFPVEDIKLEHAQDAIVNFQGANVLVDILIPKRDSVGAKSDIGGQFLQTLTKIQNELFESAAGTGDALEQMRSSDATKGVYRVYIYDSADEANTRKTVNHLITSVQKPSGSDDYRKIYLNSFTGLVNWPAIRTQFSIYYLAVPDKNLEVNEQTLRVHATQGNQEASDNYQLLTEYKIDIGKGQLFAVPGSDLINIKAFADFDYSVDQQILTLYQTNLQVLSTIGTQVIFSTALACDVAIGESILLQGNGQTINLTNETETTFLSPGWYTLSVRSKEFSQSPSAIKSVVDAVDIEDGQLVFRTSSPFFNLLSIRREPLKFLRPSQLFNHTKKEEDNSFSLVKVESEFKLIVKAQKEIDEVFTIPDISSQPDEKARYNLRFMAPEVFETDTYKRLNLRIRMRRTAGFTRSLDLTPVLRQATLKVEYA